MMKRRSGLMKRRSGQGMRGWRRVAAAIATLSAGWAGSACQVVAGIDQYEPGSSGAGSGKTPCGDCVIEETAMNIDEEIRFIALNGSHVFLGSSSIWRADLELEDGTPSDRLTGDRAITGLAASDEWVMWSRSPDPGTFSMGSVVSNTVDFSGAQQLLATESDAHLGPITAHDTQVYVVIGNAVTAAPGPPGEKIHCEAYFMDGMSGKDLGAGQEPAYPVSGVLGKSDASGSYVLWHTRDSIDFARACSDEGTDMGSFASFEVSDPPFGLAADTDTIYWTHRGAGGTIHRKPWAERNGLAGERIVSDLDHPRHLAVLGDHVYWFEGGDEDGCDGGDVTLRRAKKDGSGAIELVRSGLRCPSNLVVHGTAARGILYWADQRTLFRLRVTP